MEVSIKSKQKPSVPSVNNLPFIFATRTFEEDQISTSSSFAKQNHDQSFTNELTRIGMPSLTIMSKNPAKNPEIYKFSPVTSPTGRFPYQRKCRSISPPKDILTICDRKSNIFFPDGSPIVPDNSLIGSLPENNEDLEDDKDLKLLKQQYLKLVQQAPSLNFKSELFDIADDCSGTDEFDEWESSIMKKMQLH